MKVILKKINNGQHSLNITRSDLTGDLTLPNTETYLLHDICHFFVESQLELKNGFWGMLAQGYDIEQLSGKTNELTEELRRIECMVGGVQSIYSNHMSPEQYWNYLKHQEISIADKEFIHEAIPKIRSFMHSWKYLPVGESIELDFTVA
jgi:hypothetical protein